jgi:subtilisin family serine protease
MRAFEMAVVLAAVVMIGAHSPAFSQATNAPPPPVINRGGPITPLGGYVTGSIACAAVSPMIATVILGRELTIIEAYHTTLGCMLGPLGWLLADERRRRRTPHGTAIAGAIAANSKLVGVAPKVRILAVRAFSGSGESAQSTTFNILKGIDWAAAKNARIINMSVAGRADPMLRQMLAIANARGIVLVAAVGNAGPKPPPLYPGADAGVIGVTATDADDRLMPQANRGPQVAVAAPRVEILAAAPDGKNQITSGTSVAAAHVSGVAALLLANRSLLRRKCAAISSGPRIAFPGRAMKSEQASSMHLLS